MKNTIILLVIIIVSACFGEKNQEISDKIDIAYDQLFENTDSTLNILNSIKYSNELDSLNNNRIKIIYLNALYRKYELDSIDSSLFILLESFKKHKSSNEEVLANYLIGNLYYDQKKFDQAIYFLKRADLIQSSKENIKLKGLINCLLGNIYSKKEFYDTSILYFRKSIDFFQIVGDESFLGYSNSKIAEIYNIIEHPKDSIFFYINNSIKYASSSKDTFRLNYYKLRKAEYLYPEDIKGSKEILLRLYKNKYHLNRLYLLLAQDYISESNLDSARYYIKLSSTDFSDIRNELNYNIVQARILNEEKDFKKSYSLIEKCYVLRDSIFAQKLRYKIREIDRKLDISRYENENLELKIKSKNSFILGINLFFVLLLIIVLFAYWNIRNKRKNDRLEHANELHVKELEYANEINDRKKELFKINISNNINNFAKLKELKDVTRNKASLDFKLKELLDQYNISDKYWEEIIEDFDKIYDSKLSILIEKFPEITKNDIITLILIWYKVDIQDSAQLLNVGKNTIYQRRRIIKNRLNLENGIKIEDWLSEYFSC